jgi:hypothetical protein
MQKIVRVGFQLSIVEKSAILILAELEGGLSQAALIRRLIRKNAMEQNIWDEIVAAEKRKYNS